MYKMEIAFNERWSCTYNTRLKNMYKVSAFWKMRANQPFLHISIPFLMFQIKVLQNNCLAA